MLTKNAVIKFLEKEGIHFNGTNPYDIQVHDEQFFKKIRHNPALGAGEAYMDKMWDCDQLDELFFRINRVNLDEKFLQPWMVHLQTLLHKIFNFQNRLRSKKVAEQHYNLGNTLYRHMLGESMAYTCGYWREAKSLTQAQFDKYDLVCRKIHLKAGDKILELGCGWGGFAKFASENYGCEVVGVNISEEQVRYAKNDCKDLPVKIVLSDYRDSQIYNPEKIVFDKVVSIGLCEHIGYKNYKNFLKIVRENMNENGLFLLHTIGKNTSSLYLDPWYDKYIFPNGLIPSVKYLSEAMEGQFILEDLHNFGADYDLTLMEWHKNFNESWPFIKDDYDERFFRMWNYYLLSCAGAFRARSLQLWQMVLSPKGQLNGYKSIR